MIYRELKYLFVLKLHNAKGKIFILLFYKFIFMKI